MQNYSTVEGDDLKALSIIADTGSIIADTGSAIDEATRRTSCLSRRLARSLITALVAVDTAADTYASVFVLSDHIKTNHPSDAVRARRSSDNIDSVHVKASALATGVRAVNDIERCIERCIESGRRAIDDGKHFYAALNEAVQSDDGGITPDILRSLHACHNESNASSASKVEIMLRAVAFHKTNANLRPSESRNDLLQELVSQLLADAASLNETLAVVSTIPSPDVNSDDDLSHDGGDGDYPRIEPWSSIASPR